MAENIAFHCCPWWLPLSFARSLLPHRWHIAAQVNKTNCYELYHPSVRAGAINILINFYPTDFYLFLCCAKLHNENGTQLQSKPQKSPPPPGALIFGAFRLPCAAIYVHFIIIVPCRWLLSQLHVVFFCFLLCCQPPPHN